MNDSIPAAIVESMAAHGWSWDKSSVKQTLTSLGWELREVELSRDAYLLACGLTGSVYNNGADVDLIEIEVDRFCDVESLSDLEYEDKVDEFYDKFNVVTRQIASRLGEPCFSDGAAASGFPCDQAAVWISLWNLPTARLMLQQKHEDKETPFRLCIVLAPPAT